MCDLMKMFKYHFGDKTDEFSIEIDHDFENENGVTANILSVTLCDRKTGLRHYYIVKEEKPGQGYISDIIKEMIKNELHFYKSIWKTFLQIYKEKTGKELTIVPHCRGILEEGLMKIALENAAVEGFMVYDKTKCFDNDHINLIYKTYGVFHGLSMILKQKNKEEYLRLVTPLYNAYKGSFEDHGYFTPIFKGIIRLVRSVFDPITEGALLKKIDLYVSDGYKIIYNVLCQNVEDGVILHGDCWSNNFMFKYCENGNVEKIKLLDFQQVSSGSPVLDLSYSFYAGACRKSFKHLNKYLKVYHDSLAETLKEFDLDVEIIYPFKMLKEEWRKYSKVGFALALMLWRVKFADEDLETKNQQNSEDVEILEPLKIRSDKEEEYKEIIRDLVYHMYENDFL